MPGWFSRSADPSGVPFGTLAVSEESLFTLTPQEFHRWHRILSERLLTTMSKRDHSMSSLQNATAAVDIENIGGIDSTTIEFTPGVTVLVGRNATNRTSFLQALIGALGSDRASLKGDADRGTVTLELEGETYTRELARTNGGVAFAGDPYLEDPQLADLFAFLLESNPARHAVVRDEDLRELILRPVDVDEIEARISQLQAEKRDIDNQLSELSVASRERDSLEEEHTRLVNQLETAEADLETARESLQDIQESESGSTDSEQLDALRETQSQLEDVTYDLETGRGRCSGC